jgi:hypothetical protein
MTQKFRPEKIKSVFVLVYFLVVVLGSCSNHSSLPTDKHSNESLKGDSLLNSERIRQKYGSYGVELIYSDSTTRITNLFSDDSIRKVMRTYAIVFYPALVDSNVINEHNLILAGGSIGQVFKENGWSITKQSIYWGEITTSERFKEIYAMMDETDSSNLAIYVYTFTVEKGGKNFDYATIAEVYHPHYLSLEDLRRIYSIPDSGLASREDLTKLLDKVISSMEQFPIRSRQLTN